MARSHFRSDRRMRRLIETTFAYIGILDSLYPVILVSKGEFNFSSEAPDDLAEQDLSFEDNRVFKERRIEREEDVNFQFMFRRTRFSFSLPMTIATKIIHAIESTYGGEAFASLDIPIVLQEETGTYRRIFRIRLALPYRSNMINAFRQTT